MYVPCNHFMPITKLGSRVSIGEMDPDDSEMELIDGGAE